MNQNRKFSKLTLRETFMNLKEKNIIINRFENKDLKLTERHPRLGLSQSAMLKIKLLLSIR